MCTRGLLETREGQIFECVKISDFPNNDQSLMLVENDVRMNLQRFQLKLIPTPIVSYINMLKVP